MSEIEPPAVQQEITTSLSPAANTTTQTPNAINAEPDCPFCTICTNFPPTSPLSDVSNSNVNWNPEKLDPPAFVLLSTEDVIAFMDIAPLTRGHVLVAPKRHRVKVGDMRPGEMAELGRLLPLLSRAVIRAVLPDIPHAEADYNIVQNDGPGAAQVVPHVHFHIVPRPPLGYRPPSPNTLRKLRVNPPYSEPSSRTRTYSFNRVNHRPPTSKTDRSNQAESDTDGEPKSKYPPNKIPYGIKRSAILFGRGMRYELDEEDAGVLVEEMRRCVGEEWRKEFGENPSAKQVDEQKRGMHDRPRDRGGERSPEKL